MTHTLLDQARELLTDLEPLAESYINGHVEVDFKADEFLSLISILTAFVELSEEAVSSKLAHDCGFNAGVLVTEARFRSLKPQSPTEENT